MIVETLVVGMIQANCFLVADPATKKALIIDPGGDAPVIAQRVEQLGLEVEAIVLTHGHFDHVEGVGELVKLIDAPVYCHAEAVELIRNLGAQGNLFNVPVRQVPVPEKFLADGDTLPFGELTAKVLHTPGHSPGSISLAINDHVFVGDLLFKSSIGRTDLMGGNYETLLQSVRQKIFTLPEAAVVHPGHGPDTTVGAELHTNPFFR